MTALTTYTPRFEPDEIKTELEIAEESYHAADETVKQYSKIANIISNRAAHYSRELSEAQRQFRNKSCAFKRSIRRDTKARLYRKMVELQNEIQYLNPIVEGLNQLADFIAPYNSSALFAKQIAEMKLGTARANAGLNYTVRVDSASFDVDDDEIIRHEAAFKTVAEAVAFIYRQPLIVYWNISREQFTDGIYRNTTIAAGQSLNVSRFTELIDKHDAKTIVVDAEIVTSKNQAPLADDFNSIVIRAMHYFALDNFLAPIAELRRFCRENPNYTVAQDELAEWIDIARANGVDVPAEQPINFNSPLAKVTRKFISYWQGQGEYYGKGSGLLSGAPAILEEWRTVLKNSGAESATVKAFNDAVRKFNESAYAKNADITVESYSPPEQAANFGIRIITSRPNKRGALICYCNGEKISYAQAQEIYSYNFSAKKVIWCYGLNEIETAARIQCELAEIETQSGNTPPDASTTTNTAEPSHITVNSYSEAWDYISPRSEKCLAPNKIGDWKYHCIRASLRQGLIYREYIYADQCGQKSLNFETQIRRTDAPLVFEIDDFNNGAGTFAEFYVDGQITVIHVVTDSARRLINDTQMMISFVDSQREIMKFHEAAINIWEKERADLSAGLISENHLTQNVSKLKGYPASAEIAKCVADAAERLHFP